MNGLRCRNTYNLGVILLLLLVHRYGTSALLRHGNDDGSLPTTKQYTTTLTAASNKHVSNKRRNIKNKKSKGSKYYHHDDDDYDDNNDDAVNKDKHHNTTETNTTSSPINPTLVVVTAPSLSPTTMMIIAMNTSKDSKGSGASITIKKQTMKKNMEASTKDKLSKKDGMASTTSKEPHPTKSPKAEPTYNPTDSSNNKKGDGPMSKQMDTKSKNGKGYYFVEELTHSPIISISTRAPMIPVPATTVRPTPSITTGSNSTTIRTSVPVISTENIITFAPIPPPPTTIISTNTTSSTTTNTTNSTTMDVTTTNMTTSINRVSTSSIDSATFRHSDPL